MNKRKVGLLGVAVTVGLVLMGCSSEVSRAEDEAIETLQGRLEDGAGEYRAIDAGDGRAIVLYPEEDSEFGQMVIALQEEVQLASEREEGSETWEDIGEQFGVWIMWAAIAESLMDNEELLTSEHLVDHSVGLVSPTDAKDVLLLVNDGEIIVDEVMNLDEETF